MLEAEHLPGPAEARLDLVHHQHDVMLPAPRLQLARVLDGQKVRPHTLVALGHHAGDPVRGHTALGETGEEQVKRGVRILVAVREGHLDELGATGAQPALALGHPARELGAHRPPVEGVLEGDHDRLGRTVLLQRVGLGQLDAVLGRLAARGEQEHGRPLQLRGEAAQHAGQPRPPLVRKDVRRQQRPLHGLLQRRHNPRVPVARVSHEHARGPVDPAVAPAVGDGRALRVVPDDGRLAGHRPRLAPAQLLEERQ